MCLYRGVHIQENASLGLKYNSPCLCSTRTRQVSLGHLADQQLLIPAHKSRQQMGIEKKRNACMMGNILFKKNDSKR